MYQIEKIRESFQEEPWNIPLSERIEIIKKAKGMHLRTAAFLYPRFDSSTFRYRGFNIAQTLEYSFRWKGSWFQYDERDALQDVLSCIDVLVLVRCHWDEQSDVFLEQVRHYPVTLCFDIDDLVYSPRYMPELIKALGLKEEYELNFWFGQTLRYQMIIQQCDACITTNEYLAAHIRADLGKPCFVLKNYLNWHQERVSEEYFTRKQKTSPRDPFEIGYFSGSHTHVKDLMMIMPEISRFLECHDQARLKIVGYMDFPKEWESLVAQGRVIFVPFQSFKNLQYEQAQVDVNIVPLVENEFSNCKSELKYFENAVVGTITCATPTFAFRNAIRSGQNGYLCREGEWLEVLEALFAAGTDPEMQRSIRTCALKEYAGKNQLKDVETVFHEIMNVREILQNGLTGAEDVR